VIRVGSLQREDLRVEIRRGKGILNNNRIHAISFQIVEEKEPKSSTQEQAWSVQILRTRLM
jgi:hypothetical protein